ncbi:MAG: serine/threonine-protein kinase [Burkholderiaceae bacterium]
MSLARAELARLSELLDQALDLPASKRTAWLDDLPPADAALRPRLAELLADAEAPDDDQAGLLGLLDALPSLAGAAADARLSGATPAMRQVGPYCLLRPLGQGGMGTVWLAERVDGSLQRAVALKLPNLSTLQQPGLAHRFERERDILAALEHPHIARLYDAGVSDDGQPWLALEYVEGQPITTWCDQAQLSLNARIELFLQVLQAVQYAHARLVVHRDLKPSNIFVTNDGQVRLLDFGIATLLDEGDTPVTMARTEWAHAPMTPDYASPEQIGHQPIGTGSDVYSLGVVFYELVTGQRPYRLTRDTRGALEDAILGVAPDQAQPHAHHRERRRLARRAPCQPAAPAARRPGQHCAEGAAQIAHRTLRLGRGLRAGPAALAAPRAGAGPPRQLVVPRQQVRPAAPLARGRQRPGAAGLLAAPPSRWTRPRCAPRDPAAAGDFLVACSTRPTRPVPRAAS